MSKRLLLSFITWVFGAISLHAIPERTTTLLPAPSQFDMEDQELVEAI
jgi:hypothetical protein